ncbi:MAG: disulfide reductase, partial [Candidatus Hecatellales archaeon B24]
CPVKLPNEFDYGLSQRKAIYLPFEEAVPKRYLIDPENCLKLTKNVCEVCKKVCKADAIDFEMKEETVKVTADAIIIATGIEAFDARLKENYGYGRYKNVVISPQIERMIVPTGPTKGKIIRPGDGKEPKRFAFILCVGSRDEQVGNLYCSRVCCMYAIKEASFLKRRDPSRSIYLFYTDIRAFGKGFEEYYNEAQKVGVKFIRGRVAEIKENPETGNLTVKAENTLTGEIVELEFDLIVLAVGLVANPGSTVIKECLKLPVDSYGFFTEAHPKLKPVETILDGVFICGCAAGPKDIPDSVAQAGAAAAKTMNLLAREAVETDPIRVYVDDALCDGCGECLEACPLKAISLKESKAAVNPLLCKGCGSCVGSCSKGALNLANYTDAQLEAMIKAAVERSFAKPLLLVFIDDWAAYHVSDFAGLNRLSYPPNLLFIRVPSTCRVHHRLILKALSMGVDGVFLADTEFASAPYIDESMKETDKAVGKAREALAKLGLDPERVTFLRYVSTQAPRFAMTMRKFAESMKGKTLSDEDRVKIKEFLGGI